MSFFNAARNVLNNIEDLVDDLTKQNPRSIPRSPDVEPPKSGLSLTKGQRITLEKNGKSLSNVCVGVNWGMIQGAWRNESVDLDVSCITFKGNRVDETVYFGNLSGTGISHSGDDLTGDSNGNDGIDNEIITLNLERVNSSVDQIFIILNSYRGHKFDKVPYATIRLYEGTPKRVDNVIATYDIANDSTFNGAVSMVMGKLYRKDGAWRFNAIGDASPASNISGITKAITEQYI
jgi:tellurium resistance protein TerZ